MCLSDHVSDGERPWVLGSRASPPPLPRAPRVLACWQLRPQFSGNPAVVGEMTKALQPAATVPARHTALCTLHTAHCTIEGAACHVCIASHGRCHGGSRTQQQSAVSAHRRRRNRAMLRFSFPRQTVELLTRAPSAGCASSLAPVGRRRPWGGGKEKRLGSARDMHAPRALCVCFCARGSWAASW